MAANENNKKRERPGAMIYFELIPVVDELTDTAAGKFFKALLHYAKDETEPDFKTEQVLKVIWPLVKQRLDHDNEKYISIGFENSLKRRYAGYKTKKTEAGEIPLSYDEWKESMKK